MQYLISWFRTAWGIAEVNRSVLTLQQRIDKLSAEKSRSDKELLRSRKQLEQLQESVDRAFAQHQQKLVSAESMGRRMEETLHAANESLKTANEILIPGLVLANQVMMSRWESQVQIESMRQVALKRDDD